MHYEVIHLRYLTVIRFDWLWVHRPWLLLTRHLQCLRDGLSSHMVRRNLALGLLLYLLEDAHRVFEVGASRLGLSRLNDLFEQLGLGH